MAKPRPKSITGPSTDAVVVYLVASQKINIKLYSRLSLFSLSSLSVTLSLSLFPSLLLPSLSLFPEAQLTIPSSYGTSPCYYAVSGCTVICRFPLYVFTEGVLMDLETQRWSPASVVPRGTYTVVDRVFAWRHSVMLVG